MLENISITFNGGAKKEINYFPVDSLHLITEAEKDYPEFSMFGELPAWGFYVRHVEGLEMKNIKLNIKEDDYRAAMIFDDVRKLKLVDLKIPSSKIPVIVLNQVSDHSLQKLSLPVDQKQGVRIQ